MRTLTLTDDEFHHVQQGLYRQKGNFIGETPDIDSAIAKAKAAETVAGGSDLALVLDLVETFAGIDEGENFDADAALAAVKRLREQPKPIRVLVAMEGGLIQGGCADVPVELVTVDYDVEGVDAARITLVPQDDGSTSEGYIGGDDLKADPAFIDRVQAAGPTLKCPSCGETCGPADPAETTWEQWKCPSCGSWNDNPEDHDEE